MNLKEELELKKAQEMKDEKRRASDGTFIVDEEYTVRDVENFIIDNIYKKKMEFLEKNNEKLRTLLLEKQKDYFKEQESYLGQKEFEEIFFKYYFAEHGKFIPLKRLENYDVDYYLNELGYTTITPKGKSGYFDKHLALVCRKEDCEKGRKLYDNALENTEIWSVVAEKVFAGPLQRVRNILRGQRIEQLKYATGIDRGIYNLANGAKKYEQLREILTEKVIKNIKESESLTEMLFIQTPCSGEIFITKENLGCIVSVGTDKEGWVYLEEDKYFSMCRYDVIEVEQGENTSMFEATVAPGPLKKSSVVANAAVGTLIGGTTGGIIGAASAIDTNNRRASAIANYQPLMVEAKVKKTKYCVTSIKKQEWVIIVTYKPLEALMNALRQAQSDEACLNGELIKDFLLEQKSEADYSEAEFLKYASKRKQELYDAGIKYNPGLEKIVAEGKNIQKRLENNEKEYSQSVESIEKEYDQYVKDKKKEIEEIENQIQACSIIKIKKKWELKSTKSALEKEMKGLEEKKAFCLTNAEQDYKDKKKSLHKMENEFDANVAPVLLEMIYNEQERLF